MEFTGQLGQCHAHRLRHGGLLRVDLRVLVVLAHGGPVPRGVLGGSPEYLPHGRTQAGDRRLKIHELWDNLAPIRWRGQVQMIGGLTSLPVVDESIVDLVGIRMGMNCGPMLPLMPTTEPLWSLFVQVVPLCFWL